MSEDRGYSNLTRYAPLMRDPDPDGAWNFAKRQWHENGVATFIPAEVDKRCGYLASQEVKNLANQCYGKRKEEK